MKPRHAAALALALVGWFLLLSPARAMKFCEEDSLSEVSGSGATLEMLSGHIYKVDGIDQFEASLWRTPEAVLICSPTFTIEGKTVHSYKITNLGEDGEEVHATQLK